MTPNIIQQFYDAFGITGIAIIILAIATGIGAITAYLIELGDTYLD